MLGLRRVRRRVRPELPELRLLRRPDRRHVDPWAEREPGLCAACDVDQPDVRRCGDDDRALVDILIKAKGHIVHAQRVKTTIGGIYRWAVQESLIGLPHEQEPNGYSTPDLTFLFHYFAVRKLHFAMRANALVVFPGGFGTLDELFEVLTLVQTSKMRRVPIVLVSRSYWSSVINFERLVLKLTRFRGDPTV